MKKIISLSLASLFLIYISFVMVEVIGYLLSLLFISIFIFQKIKNREHPNTEYLGFSIITLILSISITVYWDFDYKKTVDYGNKIVKALDLYEKENGRYPDKLSAINADLENEVIKKYRYRKISVDNGRLYWLSFYQGTREIKYYPEKNEWQRIFPFK